MLEVSTNSSLYNDEGIMDYRIERSPTIIFSTVIGKRRTLAAIQPKEWAFMALTCVNLFLTTAITIERLIVLIVVEKDPTSPDFTFTILLLLNVVFCGFYAIHGVLRERRFEVYAVIAAISVVLFYCIIEYIVNVKGRQAIKLVRLIGACVLAPLNVFLAIVTAKEFGFLDFRIVGASQLLQRINRTSALFSCFIKFDLQIALSIVVLVMTDGTNIKMLEIITIAVGIPYSVLWMILGIIFVQRESKFGMALFAVLSLPAPAYVIYKLVDFYSHWAPHLKSPEVLLYTQIFATAVFLVVRFILCCEAVLVVKNFNLGLKEKVLDDGPNETTGLLSNSQSHNFG